MHIDQLKHLILVHRLGSINKACEQAHTSQQNLSTSMRKLEEEVGFPLFIRHSKGITLSENGLLLEKAAEEITLCLEQCIEEIARRNQPQPKVQTQEALSLLFSPIIGTSILPTIIKVFSQNYPTVSLKVMEKEAQEIMEIITEENAMGLITSFTPLEGTAEIFCQLIYIDKVYAVLAPTHPLSKQKSVSLKTLLHSPLTVYQNSYSQPNPICTLLEAQGVPQYHTVTNNLQIYQNAIMNHGAIGFIPKSALRNNTALPHIRDKMITLPIKNMPMIGIYLYVSKAYQQAHQQSIADLLTVISSIL